MSKKNEISGLVTGLVALIAVACFILLGFMANGWGYAWLVFLAIPVTAIIMDIVTKNKDFSGSIVGIVVLLAVAAYMIMGFVYHIWHPSWLVFLAIPLAAILTDIAKKKDFMGSLVGFIAVLATAVFLVMGFTIGHWEIVWVVFLLIPITSIIGNIIKVSKKSDGDGGKEEQISKT